MHKLSSFALIAFIVGGTIGSVLFNLGGVYVNNNKLNQVFGNFRQFKSYDELKEYINNYGSGQYLAKYYRSSGFPLVQMAPRTGTFAVNSDAVESTSSNDYSGTNIQVEGVDEADVVKTDGEYIFFAREKQVFIVKAYPANDAGIIKRINIESRVSDIYISNNILVVFSSSDYYFFYQNNDYEDNKLDSPKTTVTIFDITNRSNPSRVRELVMDGTLFNSRLIGDYLYYIITNPAFLINDEIILPSFKEKGTWSTIEPTQIWCPNNTQGWMIYYTIVSLNIKKSEAQLTKETFLLDSGSSLYVSPTNLYVTSLGWSGETAITKIGIEQGTITFKSNGTVPGYVLNQFSMDEYQGYFRIATTDQNWRSGDSSNNFYVLDEDMKIVGRLEELAPGENIYSARFIGERCYLVTFKKVDPLFTIDLSNPENPFVLGKLKIPGYSDYLHPYDDNTLIGIGKETVEAEEGDFAWYQGVKISLFDISDVENPRELAKIEIGDRGTESPALYDHHAFLFSRVRNLLVIPILEATIDENDFTESVPDNFYGEYSYQGAYVFDISLEGIELKGRVTHLEDVQDILKSGYWFDSEYEVQRSLYIKENLYTFSQGMIKINNLETLSELITIELGE
jgi:uncharacterized secreted protein with C-terminal beta-propeller domain